MRYDSMPFDIIPPAKTALAPVAKSAPQPRQIRPGIFEDPVTGRMFTRFETPLGRSADDLDMMDRDAPRPVSLGVDLAIGDSVAWGSDDTTHPKVPAVSPALKRASDLYKDLYKEIVNRDAMPVGELMYPKAPVSPAWEHILKIAAGEAKCEATRQVYNEWVRHPFGFGRTAAEAAEAASQAVQARQAELASTSVTRQDAAAAIVALAHESRPMAQDLLARFGVRKVAELGPAKYREVVEAANRIVQQLHGLRLAAKSA